MVARFSVMFFKYSVAGLLLSFVFSTSLLGNEERAAPERPLVVCFGDSLTFAGYPAELEKLAPVRTLNAGLGGNTSRQGLKRLERDVLSHKPDVVIVLFGTNDTRIDAPGVHVPLPEYERNLSEIIQRSQNVGAQVILATLPPINSEAYFQRHDKALFDAVGGLHELLNTYRAAVVQLAETTKTEIVDLHQLLLNDPNWLAADGVHPTPEGTETIARHFADVLFKVLPAGK